MMMFCRKKKKKRFCTLLDNHTWSKIEYQNLSLNKTGTRKLFNRYLWYCDEAKTKKSILTRDEIMRW